MSDRHDLETLDLDAAFDQLSADIDSVTRTRGAELAIRSVRRRRLAAAGATLAVAAVLAGVLIGTLGLPGSHSVAPVGMPDPLPAPRAFDAESFDQAARGWISGWTEGASPLPTDLPCTPYEGKFPEPLDTTNAEFRASSTIGALHKVETFANEAQADDTALALAWDQGCDAEVIQLHDEIWTGGESLGWEVKTERQRWYEFVVVHERKVAVLEVVGADQMDEDVRKQVVLALLADLRT